MKEREITTTDLADFGYREIREAIELLDTWMKHGLPDEFEEDEVRVMFNTNSGCVFLTNSEYQAAMMHDGKIEIFHSCPTCGREGFKEEFDKDSDCEDCREIAGTDDEKEEQ